MKAVFIPTGGYPDLDFLNRELKDAKGIIDRIGTDNGVILIIDNITRADKLRHIKELSK